MKQSPSSPSSSSLSSAAAPRIISRVRAKALKPDLALFAKRERKAHGLTQKEVANDAGTSHQNVSLWENPNDPTAPTVLHVVEMQDEARPLSIAHIRWQADRVGGVQVIETPAVIEQSESARSARVLRKCTDVLRANADRCAAGDIDVDKLEHETREADEAIATLAEHRAYLVRLLAQRRGGQP